MAHIMGHALTIEKETLETSAEVIRDQTCTPGYYSNEDKRREHFEQMVSYGDGPILFFNVLTKWRDAGGFSGLNIT